MAQRPAAGGEEAEPELFVGGAAAAEDGEAGGGCALGGLQGADPDLVGPPVADGPERIRVAPQELGAHGVHRAPRHPRRRPRPCRNSRRYCSTPPTNASPPPQAVDKTARPEHVGRTAGACSAVANMLPRQRRAGVATEGARRKRMRPWQRPEGRWRVPDPVGADGVAGRRTTEANVPGVAFPAAPGPYRLKSGQPPVRPSTALRVSANRSAQP